MEPKYLLLHSQQAGIGKWPEPDEFGPHPAMPFH